ncbi:MAG: hypothetical protein N3A69_18135 [Leptospiraceae bacterium]|nr:hypothetical protein [Leptospiraceae bacterium]
MVNVQFNDDKILIEFIVRNEAALKEGKFKECALDITKVENDVVFHIVFKWIVEDLKTVENEPYKLLKRLGFEWDDLDLWLDCDYNIFLLFNKGKYVASVIKTREEEA